MIELNLERLLCPMPVIKVQQAINTLKPGEQLKAICTDPGTLHDIPAWCRVNGHKVINIIEENHKQLFLLEAGEG